MPKKKKKEAVLKGPGFPDDRIVSDVKANKSTELFNELDRFSAYSTFN
jgi:hypothetical protein